MKERAGAKPRDAASQKVRRTHPLGRNLDKTRVQILSINDFHGQITAGKKVAGRPAGSAPVLLAYLKSERDAFDGQTFFVHAGDFVGGSLPQSALLQDEPALGNLIADAQRAVMETDFAMMNPGGIRADCDAGEVTWGELYTIQPFNNNPIKMALTGHQLYEALNRQWDGQPYPRILQVSGLTYTWDASRPLNDRVVEIRKNGIPIDTSATYTVTVNSYLAAGGDNFSVFAQGANPVAGPTDLDALVRYIKQFSRPFSAAIEGRITRLH